MVKSMARMTIELVCNMHELLPTQHKASRPNANPVEAALNLDEDTLRQFLGVVRMTNDHLNGDDSANDEAIDELA
jgi:hypothetical protein